jgi:4'-phosphopantetheinyl transferase EntD
MTKTKDLRLQRVIDSITLPGILFDHRMISPGDELDLLPDELGAFAKSVVKVRRASGAARIVARELLGQLGRARGAIPKGESGAPVWPEGLVGSLAHDAEIAVAAIAMRQDFLSLGVDVEPAEALDPDIFEMVATATERRRMQDDRLGGRLLFSVKEAVYKAAYPLDNMFLDHHDVEVSLDSGVARVCNGRTVRFRYGVASHVVVLAFIPV